ncbi:hypothetical protein GCM10022234_21350 [Aeromicrobium panaciterrae]
MYAAAMTAVLVMGAIVVPSLLVDDSPGTPTSTSPAVRSQVPLSEWVQPERLNKAVQLLAAMQELRDDTAAASGTHQLLVTIRDEPPLDIWRAEGSVCVIDEEPAPMLQIARNDGTQVQPDSDVPARAALLDDGACEAHTTIAVEDEITYYLAIKLAGRDDPKTTAVVSEGTTQEVTLSR